MKQEENATSEIINQLKQIIGQLNDEEFAKPIAILSGNSIGKHIRHIIEFYECLMNGYESGKINYDSRNRNQEYEVSVNRAIEVLICVESFMFTTNDKPLLLLSAVNGKENEVKSATSFSRELVYNLEHTTHHMAIIGIALKNTCPQLHIPENFGIAYSTIQYQNQ